jgi:hypothetical protein
VKPTTIRARSVISVRRWQQKFLRALSQTPSVKHACRAAGVSRQTAYVHRAADRAFAADWQDAISASVDELESVAFKKAAEGDSHLITFLLRCHKPEVYRERSELAVAGGVIFLPTKQKGDE